MPQKENNKRFRNLFARRGLLILISAAVMLELTAVLQYYYSRKGLREEAINRAESELALCEAQISDVMDQVETAVRNDLWAVRKVLAYPDSLYSLTQRMLEYNPVIYGSAVAMIENYYPSKGRLYSPYSFRDSSGIHSIDLGTETYDYPTQEWFTEALTHPDGYWSEPYYDEGGGEMLMTTFSMPLYDKKGRTVAVLTADMSLEWLTELVGNVKVYPSAFSILVSRSGQMMVAPAETLVMQTNILDVAARAAMDSTEGRSFAQAMLAGEEGSRVIRRGDLVDHVFFSPLERTGWSMAIVIPEEEIYGKVKRLGLVVAILQLLGLVLLVFIIRNTAVSFLRLQDVEQRKDMMESELKIASGIQMSMLPKTFPHFPERCDLDMYGVIIPAKEVGGDLYDFFIRDDRLFFCIGDVSGKGVPASLVMAVTRSLFRTVSGHEGNPDRILATMNDSMTEMNESNMFVTCFIGIMDLGSGVVRYSNAGHNAPLVLGKEGVRMLDVHPNVPLGVLEGMRFTTQEMILSEGESLFLYTDGLTEAENAENQLYGETRLLEATAHLTGFSAKEQVDKVEVSVREHVADAPQSDDLTILNIKYMGRPKTLTERHLILHNDIQQIPQLADFVETIASESGMDQAMAMQVNLALEEAVTNVIMYAYPAGTDGLVDVEATLRVGEVEFLISDSGCPFDPTSRDEVDTSLSAEERPIGGLGVHLVRRIMDEVSYSRVDDRNMLRLIKKLSA